MRLAEESLVVPPIALPPCSLPPSTIAKSEAGAHARGFTLIEMLAVIVIVSILAAMAIPASGNARLDRHVYEDAGSIAELFRQARARAVARGAAVMVLGTTNGSTDRGTFMMYEAVSPATYSAYNTCRSPASWNLGVPTLANGINVVTGTNLNGSIQATAGIQTAFSTFSNSSATATATPSSFAICYTPLGQSYLQTGVAGTTVSFDGALPMMGSVQVQVQRTVSGIAGSNALGLARTVVIPPNGMARVAIAGS